MATREPMSTAENKEESVPEVGCRACSWTISMRYIVMILGIIGGIIIIVATPKSCPSGSVTETCIANGTSYDCRNGNTCMNKSPSPGAIIGGVIIIILSSIFGCLSCCHQSRCMLSDKHYNDKICMCC